MAAALLALPAVAQAKTETATSGPVTATFSFDEVSDEPSGYRNLRLRVDRGGVTMVDEAIEKDCSFCWAVPAGGGGDDSKSLFLLDLEADQEPEVVVNLFTGGANCCFYSLVWRFDGTRYQRHRLLPMGSFAFDVRNIDRRGPLELVSQDYRFAYRYGSNADTPRPVRIFRFRAGRLVDVTRSFRSFPRRDASRLYRFYLRLRRDEDLNLRGVLAAYVADEYKAGRGRIAWRRLRVALRRGELDRGREYSVGKFGPAFMRDLRRFLVRTGYIRRR